MPSKSEEETISLAILAWKRGEFPSKVACAAKYGVDCQLFKARLAGRRPKQDIRPANCRLLPSEERAILDFMGRLADLGIHGTRRTIETHANYLIKQRGGGEPVSTHWKRHFLQKHSDKLRLQRDTIKELDRAVAEDPVELYKWYTEYIGVVQRCGIQATDIWNCDETGFRIGIGKSEKLVVRATPKRQRVSSAKDSERELVTLCECINDTDASEPSGE